MNDSLTREELIAHFAGNTDAKGQAILDDVLSRLGFGAKQTFEAPDLALVAQGLNQSARRALVGVPRTVMSDGDRAHMKAMLDAIEKHALPLLREHAAK